MRTRLVAAFLAALGVCSLAHADEGMWTFDAFPTDKMRAAYGWAPDDAWLDRVRGAAVRLTSGCSASFVSKDGLLMTNWHCSLRCAQNVSSVDNDYVKSGYVAAQRDDEKVCPGVQADVLSAILDVSDRVKAAIARASSETITKATNAEIAAIEQDACNDKPKFRCSVVTLYHGGQFKLYTYRKYTDVRLVFIPEQAIGFFGGDPDNFNFPRYCLDVSFLRLYEDGLPVVSPVHLGWRKDVPKVGEPLLIPGNPGSSRRLNTMPELQFGRDAVIPARQLIAAELRGRLYAYSALSDENRRQAADTVFGVENSFKGEQGRWQALLDPAFMAKKQKAEDELRAAVAANGQLLAQVGDPWRDVDTAMAANRSIFRRLDMLEARAGSISSLFGFARTIVRGADERAKPNGERLPEFTLSSLPLTEKRLLAPKPVYPGLERIGLELWLAKAREWLTVDDPAVRTLLGKESPEGLAERLTTGSALASEEVRKALWTGGKAAVEASTDPLILFMRAIDADARAVRAEYESKVEGPLLKASNRIARARFALSGGSTYPDGTFSPRLTYGKVAGWTHLGRSVAPVTQLGGIFDRATGAYPFELPQRWLEAKSQLKADTPFNMASDHDIIGGNSGSPLIDAQGRVTGAIFDGNSHSLGGVYGYDGALNRSISVATPAIEEALRKIYHAGRIMDEVTDR